MSNCKFYILCPLPGKYSAQIFEKLGHTLHCKVVYDEFRDEAGELLLRYQTLLSSSPFIVTLLFRDTREHDAIRNYVKAL